MVAFDKSERYNNGVKFCEGGWVTGSNLIKEEHLIFQRNGQVADTFRSPLSLALRDYC